MLTWRQRKVLQVIRESVQRRGYPPSMREIGEGTVRLLLQILNGQTAPPESITLPHTLIVRSSTGPPPER